MNIKYKENNIYGIVICANNITNKENIMEQNKCIQKVRSVFKWIYIHNENLGNNQENETNLEWFDRSPNENHLQFINKNKDDKCVKNTLGPCHIYGDTSVAVHRKKYPYIMEFTRNAFTKDTHTNPQDIRMYGTCVGSFP